MRICHRGTIKVLKFKWVGIQSIRFSFKNRLVEPEFVTVCIDGVKKIKLRPEISLGALIKGC